MHLFEECQFYTLKTFGIDDKLVFDHTLPFQKKLGRRNTLGDYYENAKLLHGEIIEFYAKLLKVKLEEEEAKALERMIYASRNIMNSMKNIKGLRHDMEEFDSTENKHLNRQYRLFRRRLIGLYHSIHSFFDMMGNHQEQYRILLRTVIHIEQQDAQFVSTVMELAGAKDIDEREISSLLMANRLFSQSCRLQVFALKDLLLGKKEIEEFDHAMEMKEMLDEEHGR